ncbi:MAG: hypothetical protein ABIV51_08665 [Saprospiraceae bacterium]
MKASIFILFCLVGLNCQLIGQTQAKQAFQDVVYLKNGSVLKGHISTYKLGEGIQMTTVTGFEMAIPDNLIDKVEQVELRQNVKAGKEAKTEFLRNTGMYYTIEFGPTFNISRLGMDMRFSSGYLFHHLLGLGAGFGYDNYGIDTYSPIFPVYGEIRGYILPRSFTPFYNVKVGYGFAGNGRSDEADRQVGGLFFHPQIGLRFSNGGRHVNCALSAGLKWQKATYTYIGNWPEQSIKDYQHLSSNLTFSLNF